MTPSKKILSQDGEVMLSARKVAARLDCAPDYVTKLCREGKLVGVRVRNAWYVKENSIAHFEKDREAARLARSEELAATRRQEQETFQNLNTSYAQRLFRETVRAAKSEVTMAAFGLALLLGVVLAAGLPARGILFSRVEGKSLAALAQIQSPFFGVQQNVSFNFGALFDYLFGSHAAPVAQTMPVPVPTPAQPTPVPPPAPVAIAPTPTPVRKPAQPVVYNNTYPVIEHTNTIEYITAGTSTFNSVTEDELTSKINSVYQNFSKVISGFGQVGGGSIGSDNDTFLALTGGTLTGQLNSTASASSTLANGIDIAAGCFSISGVCITGGGGGGGSGTVNSGTQNQIAFYNTNGTAVSGTSTISISQAGLVSISNLSVGALTGVLQAINGTVSASSTVSVAYGGTGLSTAPSYGQVLVGNAAGGFTLTATSSLGITSAGTITAVGTGYATTTSGDITFATSTIGSDFTITTSGQQTIFNIPNASASARGLLTSTDWTTFNNKISSTSLSGTYPVQYNSGTGAISLAFGTSTSNTWGGVQTFTNTPILGALAGLVGSNNGALYQIATSTNFVTSLTAGNGIALSGATGALTVTNTLGYEFPNNATSTTLTLLNGFVSSASSTINASTTITGGLTLLGATTTTASGINIASGCFAINGVCVGTGAGTITAVGNGFATTSSGYVALATSTTGTDFSITTSGQQTVFNLPTASTLARGLLSSADWTTFNNKISSTSLSAGAGIAYNSATGVITNTLGYPFSLSGNATSSLTQFNGGITAFASSTIGNGTQVGGLTISGGATTTGIAYFASNVGIGNSAPLKTLDVTGTGKFSSTLTLGSVTSCGGGQALQTNSSGDIICNTVTAGGSSVGGGWQAVGTSVNGNITEATSTYVVAIGGSAPGAGSAQLTITSGSVSTTTLALIPASSQTADILDIYNTSGLLSSVFSAAGNLGIGTTSPAQALSVNGNGYFTGSLTLGSALTVPNGGTGSTTLTGLLVGNGANALQTASIASPLTFSGTTLSIQQANGSQNGYLSSTDWNTFNNKVSSSSLLSSVASAYPFQLAGNATSTLTQFNGGLTAFASSTIGSGTQIGGLTISGGATTTGNAYFASNVGIGMLSPTHALDVVGSISNLLSSSTVVPSIISTTAINATTSASLIVSGRYLYACCSTGPVATTNSLNIFDVSNPAAPVSLSATVLPSTIARSMQVIGRYAYLTAGSNGTAAFFIYDVSNPAAPALVSNLNLATTLSGPPKSVQVVGRYAFIDFDSPGNRMTSLDVADPYHPRVLSSLSMTGGSSIQGMAVSGHYAYVMDSGSTKFFVVDVSNPAAMFIVATTTLTSAGQSVTVGGDSRYVYVPTGTGANGLEIVDVSNPTAPVQASTLSLNGDTTFYMSLNGRYGYLPSANKTDVVHVVDLANPASPSYVGSFSTQSLPTGIAVAGRYAYIGTSQAIQVADLGGIESTSLTAHSAEIGSLQVRDDLRLSGALFANNGIDVGPGGIMSQGALSVQATTSSYFGGNVGIGTTSPFAQLSILAGGDYLRHASSTIFAIASTTAGIGTTTLFSIDSTGALTQAGGATSTFSNGIVLTGGCITVGSTCIGGAGTITAVGNGFATTSSGYVALATSTTGTDFSITTSGQQTVFNLPTASTLARGLLSSADWTTFNNKISSTSLDTSAELAALLTDETGTGSAVFNTSPTFAGTTNFANASTSQLSVFNTAYFGATATSTFNGQGQLSLAGLSNMILAAGPNGTVVASSTPTAAAYLATSTSATSTLAGGLSVANSLFVLQGGNIGIGTTTPGKALDVNGTGRFSGTFTLSNIQSCSGNQALQTNASGDVSCASIAGQNLSTAGGWTSLGDTRGINGTVSEATSTYIVAIGPSTVTPYAQLSVQSGATGTTTLALVPVSGQTANIFDIYNTSGALASVFTAAGKFGIGSTSPTEVLSVNGNGLLSGNLGVAGLTATGTATVAGSLGVGTTSPISKFTLAGGNFTQVAMGSSTLASSSPITVGNHSYATYVSGNYAYAADYEGGLRILDVSNPKAPHTVGSYTGITTADGVVVAGKYAYVTDFTTGLVILDISNPSSPSAVGSYAMGSGDASSLALSGKYLYVNDANNARVDILDVSNPKNPTLVSTYSTGLVIPTSVAVLGKYLYITDQVPGLFIADISNPSNPVQVGSFTTGLVNPNKVVVSGRYAYIADISTGLRIVDISNPASPAAAGFYRNGEQFYDVQVGGTYAYLADHKGRMVQIDVSNPSPTASSTLVSTYTAGNAPRGIFVSGKYAYLADDAGGLQIIDINGIESPAANIGSIQSGSANIADNLNVGGQAYVGGGLDVGLAGIFSRGDLAVYGTTTLGSLNGLLQAINGVVSASSTLSVAYGGTGSTTLTGLLVGNGADALQSATISSPLTFSGTTLSIQQANGSTNGYLSSTDWTTFNSKISSSSLSGGAGISYNAATGVITNTIGYPFLGNATSTTLTFSGGLVSNGSTTVSGLTSGLVGNNNGLLYGFASSSLFGYTPVSPTQNQWFTPNAWGNSTSTVIGLQNGFISNASSTIASTLFDTNLSGGALYIGQNGQVLTAASSSIFGFIPDSFAYPFINSATTSPLMLLASTTIGNGAQAGGLTISGGATTTGNAYFAGNVGIGTSTPFAGLSVSSSAATAFAVYGSTGGFPNGSNIILHAGTANSSTGVNGGSISLTGGNGGSLNAGPGGNIVLTAGNGQGGGAPGSVTINPGTGTGVAGVLLATTGGNVGIGTTSPYAQLSIFAGGDYASHAPSTLFAIGSSTAGTATTTLFSVDSTGALTQGGGATSTFSNGINLTSGCLQYNGTCLTQGLTSALTSIGPTGQTTTGPAVTFATSTTGSDFTITGSGSTITFNLPTASASNRGLLSSADWTTFNNKDSFAYPFINSATSSIITFGGGLVSNGSTTVSGLTSGLVGNNNGLLYGFASSSLFGYTPLNPTRTISTTYPLQGGGDLSADRTLTLAFGTSTSNTWGGTQTFTAAPVLAALSGVLYGNNGVLATQATSTETCSGPLSCTGFDVLNNGGAITISQANGSTNGYLSSTDWTTFNNKIASSSLQTSAMLAALLSDETGTGVAVFNTSPTFTGTANFANASTSQLSVFNNAYFGATATSTFTSTGALGIASSSPWALLSVNPSGISGPAFAIGSSTATKFIVSSGGLVGVGTTSPWALLSINPSGISGPAFAVGSSTRTLFDITNMGNVGIGTTSPYAALSVAGRLTQASTSPLLAIGSSTPLVGGSYFSVNGRGVLNIAGRSIDPEVVGYTQGPQPGSTLAKDNGVWVSDHYAYVVSRTAASLTVFDVSNPANPTYLASTTGPIPGTSLNGANYIAVSGDYAYVTLLTGNAVAVIDISNPSNPKYITQIQGPVPGTSLNHASGIVISGNYAYVSESTGGNTLAVLDISNPANPTWVTSFTATDPIAGSLSGDTGMFVKGNYLYMTDEGNGILITIDISNPANPTEVSTFRGPVYNFGQAGNSLDFAHSVWVQGRYAYVVSGNAASLAVIDVSNPASPQWVASTTGPIPGTSLAGANQVWVSGKYAYVTTTTHNAFSVIDISDPTNPTWVAETQGQVPGTTLSNARNMFVAGNYAYVVDFTGNALAVIDIGGSTISNANIGTLQTDTLQSNGLAYFNNTVNVRGGLQVGQALLANGGGAFTIASTTSLAGRAALSGLVVDNNANTIANALTVGRGVYAGTTATAGLGAGIGFNVMLDPGSGATIATTTGQIASVLTNVASTTPAADLTFSVKNGVGALAEAMRITSTGNVGVGTTSPGSLFSIGNTNGINFSTATSTFSSTGGINLASGCFAVRGTCVGGGGSGTLTAFGNGYATTSSGYIALATSTLGTDFTITTSGQQTIFNLPTASAANRGLLSSADWTTFNNKDSFAYPFINSATTSIITFGGGLVSNGSTTVSGLISGLVGNNNGLLYGFASSSLFGYTPVSPTQNQWFTPQAWGNSTSTVIGLQNGFISNASSTFSGNVFLTSLGIPAGTILAVNAAGQIIATTTSSGGVASVSGTYPVQSSGGTNPVISLAFGTTTSNTWGGTQTFTAAPVLAALSGVLYGNNGVLATQATSTETCSGPLSCTGFDVLNNGGAITISQANGSTNGYLSSTDWNTFNNKISSSSLSGGAGISYNAATGVITNTMGYEFPNNATSTTLTLLNGFVSSASSTINASTTITGSVTLLGATTTTASGINLASGCFSINGVCVGGSGGAGTLTAFGNGYATTSSGYIALATSTAGTDFTITTSGQQTIFNLPTASASNRGLLSSADWTTFNNKDSFAYPFINSATTSPLMLLASTTIGDGLNGLTVSGNATTTGNAYFAGTVGIGTSTPYAKLSVWGGDTSIGTTAFNVVNSASTTLFTILDNGNIGIGTTSASHRLGVWGAGSSGYFAISNAQSGDIFQVNSSGNVGIGTTSPFSKLGIVGDTRVKETTDSQTALVVENSVGSTTLQISTQDTSNNIFEVATSTGLAYFDITSGGNVGIGSTSPKSTLTVIGSACFSVGAPTATINCGTSAGNLYYTTANTGNYDVAEQYLTSDSSITPGTIVALDAATSSTVTTAVPRSAVLGVVSTAPGLMLGGADSAIVGVKTVPVALAGRVPVKISLENGPIAIGDRLALSPTMPGVAVKAVENGETIGVALEPYTFGSLGSSTPTILVFINAQYTFSVDTLAMLASTTATTSESNLLSGTWGSVSSSLQAALHTALSSVSDIAHSGMRQLGDAVHASVGVFDTLITQNLTADTITAQKLCLGSTCVDEAQLKALLSGSGGSSSPSPSTPTPAPSPTLDTSSASTTTTTSTASSTPTADPSATTTVAPTTAPAPTDTSSSTTSSSTTADAAATPQ